MASPNSSSSTPSNKVVPPLAGVAGGAPVQLPQALDGLKIGSTSKTAPPPAASGQPPAAMSADENEDDDEKPLSPRKRDDDEGAQGARQKLLDAASAREAVEEQESAQRRMESLARAYYGTSANLDGYRDALLGSFSRELAKPEIDIRETATFTSGTMRGSIFFFTAPEKDEKHYHRALMTHAVAVHSYKEHGRVHIWVQYESGEAAKLASGTMKDPDGEALEVSWPERVTTTSFDVKSLVVTCVGLPPPADFQRGTRALFTASGCGRGLRDHGGRSATCESEDARTRETSSSPTQRVDCLHCYVVCCPAVSSATV